MHGSLTDIEVRLSSLETLRTMQKDVEVLQEAVGTEPLCSLEVVDGIWDKLRDVKGELKETSETVESLEAKMNTQHGFVQQLISKHGL